METGLDNLEGEMTRIQRKGNKFSMRMRCGKGKTWTWQPRNFDIEEGDRMVRDGEVFLVTASTGQNKRDAGELTPRKIKPPKSIPAYAKAVLYPNGEIYWEWELK